MPVTTFPSIRFRGELRPSQADVVAIAERKLQEGARRLHVVAPPGSGKTVLGLYLWAACVRTPAVVLSPNSAIQSQWAARTDLFDLPNGSHDLVSTDPAAPALLTSLTYQSVTLPARASEDLDTLALGRWIDRLVAGGQADGPEEAGIWIDDLRRHNRAYHDERLAAYRKEVRDLAARDGDSLDILHTSARGTLERLRDLGVGLVILDECHHLVGHWGRVLADAHDLLDGPIVVGLTATPPDLESKKSDDARRYTEFFGPVDYEVPVPAVVKDGFLAPYQDLAYIVRPSPEELEFVATADERFVEIVNQLCSPEMDQSRSPASRTRIEAEHMNGVDPESNANDVRDAGLLNSLPRSLPGWVAHVLANLELPTGRVRDWASFERRDPGFAEAGRLFLAESDADWPENVPPLDLDEDELDDVPAMSYLVPVLDRYVRHRLMRSPDPADHALADDVRRRLRLLGIQITETGTRACVSPVGRVLAFSRSKAAAIVPILREEIAALGDRIRAIVVTDFEKTSSVSTEIAHLLDAESGGAVAAFRMLLTDDETDALDPILVTGSTILVDDDAAERFDDEARVWFAERGLRIELVLGEEDGFHTVTGRGRDWCPRHYVAMVTDLFQRGITRCLVGTRGLLGEGWDANKVNVLLDLTTVTTSMSFEQLRGRSIRIDPDDPRKVANNWDVVCIAPEFSKGLDDYARFTRKHRTTFGVTDDGAIEKGVGHVHAAFTELKPEGLEGSVAALNEDMLARVHRRDESRDRWRIGEPYVGTPIRTVEIPPAVGDGDVPHFPPFKGHREPWNDATLTAAVGRAIALALRDTGQITVRDEVRVTKRSGGYVRAFLEGASEEESWLFARSMAEVFGPLHRPRYVIPRRVDVRRHTWLSWLLPSIVGRFFEDRERRMVMLHAVPSALARNKTLVAAFERRWREHVGPGEAVYAHRGEGERVVADARHRGLLPKGSVHEKDVFA